MPVFVLYEAMCSHEEMAGSPEDARLPVRVSVRGIQAGKTKRGFICIFLSAGYRQSKAMRGFLRVPFATSTLAGRTMRGCLSTGCSQAPGVSCLLSAPGQMAGNEKKASAWTFYEQIIDYEDGEDSDGIRRIGHSKEGRWAPQVVVALAVTREGLPVRSWVFPGNRADITTVGQVKKDLQGWKLGRALFVGDCGMNSEENRAYLARGCGKYILAVQVSSVKEVKEDVLSRPGRYQKIEDNLHAKEIIVADGERRRRYVLCFNPHKAKRQAKHRADIVQILKEELNKHRDRDATSRWAMQLLTSLRYKRYLKKTDDNRILLDTEAIKQARRLDGKWVLITNDDTVSVYDTASAYKSMMVIEQCFRSLKKTQIQMGPMFHRLKERIEAHVKICVLALLIQRIAWIEAKQSWNQLRTILEGLQASEFETSSHVFFQRNEMRNETREVLKKLGVATPKLVLDAHKKTTNS